MSDISVLVCDDSALMRNLIGKIIENAPGLHLAGTAMNGRFALQKIPRLKPDVVILDLEMPELDGIGFLQERQKLGYTMPVIILSSIARKGAQVTMDALSLGAADFILKPTDGVSVDIRKISETIINTVKAYGSRGQVDRPAEQAVRRTPTPVSNDVEPSVRATPPAAEVKKSVVIPPRPPAPIEIVAIGISTGGPNALRGVFADIRSDLGVPIVVVQHMPEGFTYEFARSLNKICALEVKEAQEGDIVAPGRVLIAPGNTHVAVEKRRLATVIHLLDTPPRNGHRPSADVLFESVAREFGANALGVIMTGMGRDGARELRTMCKQGGYTIGQDQESCIVYGMPRVAYELGAVRKVVPLSGMAAAIAEVVSENR